MKKNILIAGHILFWTLVLSFFIGVLGPNASRSLKIMNPNAYVLVHFGLYGLINISIFYVNLFVLIPFTAAKKKYILYLFSIVLLVVVFALLKYVIAINFKYYYLTVGPEQREIPAEFWVYTISTLFPSLFMVGFSIVYKVLEDWVKNDTIQRELTEQKTQAELLFLKSQINPHFLFNSLNNIYALAYKKSDDAPSAILKLSEIMRYMLKESEDGLVDINDEIQYLNSYIDLNRIRYKEGVHLSVNITIDKPNYRVMPLLLISFIENIFKHGLVNDANNPVIININIEKGLLRFYAKNNIRKGNKDESSGIGLKNIYRRLDLVYKQNYSLKINEDADIFELTLEIKLITCVV